MKIVRDRFALFIFGNAHEEFRIQFAFTHLQQRREHARHDRLLVADEQRVGANRFHRNARGKQIAVNIEDERTEALAAAPTIIPPGVEIPGPIAPFYNFPSSQEYRDEVELTLYGFNNEMAWQYLMSLYDASLNGNDGLPLFGFANSPAIRDAKRTQVEIAALAQKKTIRILANYNSGTADAIARRYILSASLTISLGSVPP